MRTIVEADKIEIVRRNDKNGNELDASVRFTKENCPELQEILNDLYLGVSSVAFDDKFTSTGKVKISTEKKTA